MEVDNLLAALEGMVKRHSDAMQNWTQAVVDAQRSGDRDLAAQIQNTALTALGNFPIEQAKAAISEAYGVSA